MSRERRIRIIWIVSLFTAIDAWICVAALWTVAVFTEPDQINAVANSLTWVTSVTATIATISALVLMGMLGRDEHSHGEMINSNRCCLIIAASLFSMFLCMLYSSVNAL